MMVSREVSRTVGWSGVECHRHTWRQFAADQGLRVSAMEECGAPWRRHVHYRGAGPAMQDLVAGQIDMLIDSPVTVVRQLKAGKIKAFAIAEKSRLASAPEVPTVDEAGLPGFYFSNWFGLYAPKGTPQPIVSRLNAAMVAALADANVRARFSELGQDTFPREQQTVAAHAALQKADGEKWWPIIKAANIKAEYRDSIE